MKRTLGIDEAGRGPVIGPMVLSAVCLDTRGARLLSRAGLRDSKSYGSGAKARARRTELAKRVREHAIFAAVHVVEVAVIDERVKLHQLNHLEREVAEQLIEAAPPVDSIIADGKTLFGPMQDAYPHLVAYNKAESKHASVAAASVLAKTRRDELFAAIAERYAPAFGPLTGGGYGNAGTRRFLRAYAARHRCLPPEARRSWPYVYLHDILGEDFDPDGEGDGGGESSDGKAREQLRLL